MNIFYTNELIKLITELVELIQKHIYAQMNTYDDNLDVVLFDRDLINLVHSLHDLKKLLHEEQNK